MRAPLIRAVAVVIAVLSAAALSACTNGADSHPGDPAHAKIGLLLPDSVTARYDNADRPYFEKRIRELCRGCTVLYANADGDAAKQQQQAESMLSQGVSVLVLDPYDGEAAASIVNEAGTQHVPVGRTIVWPRGPQGLMNVVEGLRIRCKCEAAQITSRKYIRQNLPRLNIQQLKPSGALSTLFHLIEQQAAIG